mmetsp:Transcript_4746/g.8630  ORF Transcript_4746/g.8630 Transcript_4746/m.8630 type:complete len:117 (-) Transcript_4746:871-1221(-)
MRRAKSTIWRLGKVCLRMESKSTVGSIQSIRVCLTRCPTHARFSNKNIQFHRNGSHSVNPTGCQKLKTIIEPIEAMANTRRPSMSDTAYEMASRPNDMCPKTSDMDRWISYPKILI